MYDPQQLIVYEGELEHMVTGFLALKERIELVRVREG